MEKRTGQQILLNKTQGHGIGLVRNLRRSANGAVGSLGVTQIQPGLELIIEILQRRDSFQGTFRNELVNRFIEPLLLSFALGIARPCVRQLNAQ